MRTTQVKSKKRVADHGEVFTNKREVNAMLDLVQDQCQRIDATFLEPACGNGNFLIEILNRKLKLLRKYRKSDYDYNKNLIITVSSIYGVELLEDNTKACKERLYKRIVQSYPKPLKTYTVYKDILKNIQFILSKNIVCGNALDYTTPNGQAIIFYEWKFINSTDVKIRCFDFELVAKGGKQMLLFSDTNESVKIVEHKQEFKPIHYLKLYTYAE